MKKIMNYKLFESVEDVDINEKMIRDLKELCMDLLDEGYTLSIDLYLPSVPLYIGCIQINHDDEKYSIKRKPTFPQKISYSFYLWSDEDVLYRDVVGELGKSICNMYPEEDIYY